MGFGVRAEQGYGSGEIRIYQGEFLSATVALSESSQFPGFYTGSYPTNLDPGVYHLEGETGPEEFVPAAFYWDGTEEIDLFTLNQLMAAAAGNGNSGGSSAEAALSSDQATQLQEVWTYARALAKGRYKVDDVRNTGTLYGADNITPVGEFDLKDAGGNPSTEQIFERVPR